MNNYNPKYTPPPTHADYHTPMAVEYKDNGKKKMHDKDGSYMGSPEAQAYYNPQIQAHAHERQEITSVVITGEPPKGPPPLDYYRTSICLTFGCFFPLGIFCWLKAIKCRDAIERGDYELAKELSAELKIYTEVTLGVGWFCYVIIVVILVVTLNVTLRAGENQ